jgi:antibiotic biosynthesis monooxygenase
VPAISVTRLRLRSFRYLPRFAWFVRLTINQAQRAPGFLGGRLALEPPRGFWTITVWRDDQAMKAFRDEGDHRRAMPHLLDWCDEASFTHWMQESNEPPDLDEARRRMIVEGRLSKVRHPSPAQAERRMAPSSAALMGGPSLRPRPS